MQTFTKAERLCSKFLIDQLVEKGKSFNSSSFRITWLEIQEDIGKAQILISVPKRIFKKAVDRNRLKRLMRETYRKNKLLLYHQLNNKKVILMFVYKAKTVISYKEMEEKMVIALQHLVKEINR
jgi:ribonuclease P protein component